MSDILVLLMLLLLLLLLLFLLLLPAAIVMDGDTARWTWLLRLLLPLPWLLSYCPVQC